MHEQLTPWRKGQSGNPRGPLSMAAVLALLLAEFSGRELSGADMLLLEHASRLLARSSRTRSADEQVRLTNASMRIVDRVRKAAKPSRSRLSPQQRIAAALEGQP
jgi:hypothetical protein